MRDNRTDNGEQAAFWRLVIESHRASGLTVKEFCQQEGLSVSSYYFWRKKLANDCGLGSEKLEGGDGNQLDKSVKGDKPPAFMEVASLSNSGRSGLTISFPGNISMVVESGCDIELFCQAVKILSGQPC